jgi:hypothetical protein
MREIAENLILMEPRDISFGSHSKSIQGIPVNVGKVHRDSAFVNLDDSSGDLVQRKTQKQQRPKT